MIHSETTVKESKEQVDGTKTYVTASMIWWQEYKRKFWKSKKAKRVESKSDLLSLAGFRTTFTSFHDITKAYLPALLPSQNT